MALCTDLTRCGAESQHNIRWGAIDEWVRKWLCLTVRKFVVETPNTSAGLNRYELMIVLPR